MNRKPHAALAKTVSVMTRTGVAMLELREAETISLGAQHHGAAVKALYDEYLGQPNSHLAHKILHTRYIPRNNY